VRTKACTGRISWNATVKKTSPIIDRDVIYSDVIRYTYHADYDGLLTNLHAHIVGQCIVLLQSTGRFANLQPPECNMPFSENLKQYAKPIRQNLSAVFTDREVNLFKAMAAWCDISPNYRELSATGCFQNVWEWVNDEVFGNQGSDQKNTDPPEYVLFGNCYKGTGEEKPDTIYSNKKYNIINIFDSKYYVPKFNGSDKKNMQVEGFPPNSDIAKQVGYYDSTTNANSGVRISNTFLVPLCSQIIEQFGEDNFPRGKLYYDIGYVKKGKMKSLTENKNSNEKNRHVNIMVVNPEKLYEKFLANEKISDEESNVIFDIYDGYGNTSTSED
jgi:hypothetical protein